MATDYEWIRRENVRRFGEETKHLAQLRDLYADPTHFVEELLQNAEDAGARGLLFHLFHDRLELSHDGRRFTQEDVFGVCGVADSTKQDNLTQIGRFGIGFKSVFAYTNAPRVYSGAERFRIEHFVRPRREAPLQDLPPHVTHFVFPFDREQPNASRAVADISQKLRKLHARTLLFLRNIERIRWMSEPDAADGTYSRAEGYAGSARLVQLVAEEGDRTEVENWMVFERQVSRPDGRATRVEVAYRQVKAVVERLETSPLVAYFPTAIETGLGFLIQGPYRTTRARDNIPRQDSWNMRLVDETAELVVDSLRALAHDDRLDLRVLAAMPLDGTQFGGENMFRPIYERVRTALRDEPLLPAETGGYVSATHGRIARPPALAELVDERQLATFTGEAGLRWLHHRIQPRSEPELYRSLTGRWSVYDNHEPIVPEIEVNADALIARLSAKVLEAQTTDWIRRLYSFLAEHKTEREAAASAPVLRLDDGSHVAPLDERGHPNAYLPPKMAGFPCVSPEVAEDEGARRLLALWGFTKPDQFAEVLESVIPRLCATDVRSPTAVASAVRDLGRVVEVYEDASRDRKAKLEAALVGRNVVIGIDARNGAPSLLPLEQCYVNRPGLREYLGALSSGALLHQGYRNLEARLVALGVREHPPIDERVADKNGYVVVRAARADHVRGLDGFDPAFEIEGLDAALATRSVEVSRYVWNELLGPRARPLKGRIERSTRQSYEGAVEASRTSPVGRIVLDTAWLPDRHGRFQKPADLHPSELPDGFHTNGALARHLGMRSDEHEKLAQQVGTSIESIQLYLLHQEEFRDYLAQKTKLEAKHRKRETPNFKDAVADRFDRNAKAQVRDPLPSPGPIENPSLRRNRVREAIKAARTSEPAQVARVRIAASHSWEARDPAVREFLAAEYGGRCQICGSTFSMANGDPYFEAVYLVSRTAARWLDRPGNALCLCADHSARFQHGTRGAENLERQILSWRAENEDGDTDPTMHMTLCGEPVELVYTERHMMDLQELVRESTSELGAVTRTPAPAL